MSIYGNITNNSRSQFYFDKLYGNKMLMEDSASSDGVFVGRFVLVEYGLEPEKCAIEATYKSEDKNYYKGKEKIIPRNNIIS